MPDQRLTVRVEAKDAKQAAQDLKSVDDAQKSLAQGTNAQADAADNMAEATEKSAASMDDYTATLARINPILGAFASFADKGIKVIKDLGTAQVGLAARARRATAAIRRNAAALKTLGAAGAAAAAIWMIVKSVQAMGDAFREATEMAKKLRDELTRQKQEFAEQEKIIRAVADARRGVAALTPQEVAAATQRARAISEQYGVGAPTALAVAGETAGLGLTREQEARYGLLRETGRAGALDPRMGARQRARIIAALDRRYAQWLDSRIGAERTRMQQVEDQARREMRQEGGTTENLQAVLRRRLGIGEEEARTLADYVQAMGGSAEVLQDAIRRSGLTTPWGRLSRGAIPTLEPGAIPGFRRRIRPSARELSQLEAALSILGQDEMGPPAPTTATPPPPLQIIGKRPVDPDVLFRMADQLGPDSAAGQRLRQRAASMAPTIYYHYDYSHNYGSDRASQERARHNGETAKSGAY